MNLQEGEGIIKDLFESKRVGNYSLAWFKNRLIAPDIRILIASFLLILIPTMWFITLLLPLYESFYSILGAGGLLLTTMSIDLYTLVDVGTSDSGIIPKSTHKVNKEYNYYIQPPKAGSELIKLKICKTCNIVRPPRSFHCRKCDSCIEVHDHHCPWTGTCIGRRTHKKFIIFLAATFTHGITAILVLLYPFSLKWNKPITNIYKLSGVILMAYSVIIPTLMFGFGLYHLNLARTNVTTNEKLRGVYSRKKPNPWDVGNSRNWDLFTTNYPSTPSSIFDNYKSLVEDEEQFYHSILSRYGKLVCQKINKKDTSGREEELVDYNNNGLIKMMVGADRISLDSSENNV